MAEIKSEAELLAHVETLAANTNELVQAARQAWAESREAWTAHHDAQDEIARLKQTVAERGAALDARDAEIARLEALLQGAPPE